MDLRQIVPALLVAWPVLVATPAIPAHASVPFDPATLEIEPAFPIAFEPFTIVVEYLASCPTGSAVAVVGDRVEITASEILCPAPPHPVTFSVEVDGLSAGSYAVALYRQLEATPAIPPERTLVTERDLQVQPVTSSIADVDIEHDDNGTVVRIAHFCPDPVFELRAVGGGIVRVRQRFIGLGAPCLFTQPPPFTTEIAPGVLDAGPYVLVIEDADDPQLPVWIEPFTVPVPAATNLGLRDGRFTVTTDWQTADDQGAASGHLLSDDSAAFWFFRPSNVELLVKVLDGCTSTGHFWVFAAGLTNQGVALTVIDTVTGDERRYANPRGNDFAPILDTRAFACP